jgi:2-hydroxyglutarate dehydrogenase
VPFRGAWLRLRPERRDLVRALVYPVPDPDLPFLGVHFTRGTDDEVLIGPTALLAGARDSERRFTASDIRDTLAWGGTYRMARRWWRTGLTELRHAADRRALVRDGARYIPELTPDDVLPGPAGVRAQALGRDGSLVDDFVVSETERALHVRNAPSPAATSSLALARLIADRVT